MIKIKIFFIFLKFYIKHLIICISIGVAELG